MLSSQPRPELYISYLRLGVLSPLALPQRSRASKVSYFFVFFPCLSHRAFSLTWPATVIGSKENVYVRKEFNSPASTGLFWNTNMAALTSWENALLFYVVYYANVVPRSHSVFPLAVGDLGTRLVLSHLFNSSRYLWATFIKLILSFWCNMIYVYF